MASKYIERQRIMDKLENILSYPLSIVHAPIGYGKTVAVKQFLEKSEARAIWVALISSEGFADFLWNRLCEEIAKREAEMGSRLKTLGFPYDWFKTQAVLDLLMDHDYKENLVIVLDDFQVIEDERVFQLIKSVVLARIKGLHIIIITRELSRLDAADLYQKELCFTITEKSLKFNKEEVSQYLSLAGCSLSAEEEQEIYQMTDGWISMIYIIMKGIRRGLKIGKSATVDDIIEQNLYGSLDQTAKEILMKLSAFNTFTKSMMAYILADPKYSDALEQLISKNLFLVYDEADNNYKIRNLLQKFLREKACLSFVDLKAVYKRGGLWYLQEKQYENAFEYLLKAEETELILEHLNGESAYDLQLMPMTQVHRIFKGKKDRLCRQYPVAYLRYIYRNVMSDQAGIILKCKGMLEELSSHLQNSGLNQEYQRYLLGEVNTIRALTYFNDIEEMVAADRKAITCFSGGVSGIVTREREFTFGSGHLLFCYYRRPGTLQETTDALARHANILTAPTDGCGTGCDSLVISEYALETGDFDRAELYAYKAYYKAKSMDQLSIMIPAKFCLDRLSIIRGNSQEQFALMTALKQEVLAENNPVLNTAFDVCNAYINACIGRFENIQTWIKSGDLKAGNFLPQGQGYFYVTYAKMLLHAKDYVQLDALCESAQRIFEPYSPYLGIIYFKIYESVSKSYLESRNRGEETLMQALAWAKEDKLVMPFAENAAYILIMLKDIVARSTDPYHRRVLEYCQEYLDQLKKLDVYAVTLTNREVEILKLLDAGNTHDEIAGQIFISVATVRYHIKNIYEKLEVNNKILALRRAKDLNLI